MAETQYSGTTLSKIKSTNRISPQLRKIINEDDIDSLVEVLDDNDKSSNSLSVFSKFIGGKTLLHFACQAASYKIVELLVNKGAEVREWRVWDPLFYHP